MMMMVALTHFAAFLSACIVLADLRCALKPRGLTSWFHRLHRVARGRPQPHLASCSSDLDGRHHGNAGRAMIVMTQWAAMSSVLPRRRPWRR